MLKKEMMLSGSKKWPIFKLVAETQIGLYIYYANGTYEDVADTPYTPITVEYPIKMLADGLVAKAYCELNSHNIVSSSNVTTTQEELEIDGVTYIYITDRSKDAYIELADGAIH